MNVIVKFILIIILLVFANLAAIAEIKIGYVDIEYALNIVDEGREAIKILDQDYEKKKKKLQARESELKKMVEEINKQGMILNEGARRAKEEEYRTKFLEFQKLLAESEKEHATKRKEYTDRIVEKFRKIIAEIGESEDFTIVMEKMGTNIIYAKRSLDLTERAIQKYNELYGKKEKLEQKTDSEKTEKK